MNLKNEKGALVFSSGNDRYNLQAASDTDFYLTSFFFNIHFIKETNGDVKRFQLNRYGSGEMAEKIK